MTPLEMHKKMFPNVNLNFYQMDLVEVEIDDMGAWEETLKFWASNDYRGQSIGKMIEYYNGVKNGSHRKPSYGKRTDTDVIEASKEFYDNFS